MNNQNQFNPVPPQNGRFCSRCGAPLDANGVCPNCQQQHAQQPQYTAPQPQSQPFYGTPVQPNQQPQQGYNYGMPYAAPQQAPKTAAGPNIFTYALEYIKAFFSADPTKALDKAAAEKQHVWSILGSGSVLLTTLGLFSIMLNSISSILVLIPGYSYFSYGMGMNADLTAIKVKLFFYTLLVIAVFFFASAGLDTLFFSVQNKKTDYIQNMNILSVCMLPIAVCGCAAFIFGFVYIPVSLILLLSGLIFKYIMLCDGIKKAAAFDKNPIWYVFGLVTANIVAFGLIAFILSKMIF